MIPTGRPPIECWYSSTLVVLCSALQYAEALSPPRGYVKNPLIPNRSVGEGLYREVTCTTRKNCDLSEYWGGIFGRISTTKS